MIGLTNLRVDHNLLHLALGKEISRARAVAVYLERRVETPYLRRICIEGES
jgi:hypothetical protein